MKREFDWVETISRWFIIIMGIIAIIMLLQKIFGLSPTSNEVLVTLFGILAGSVFSVYHKLGRVDEFMSISKRTFLRIGADIKDIRKDITDIKIDMNKEFSDIKKEISIIKKAIA